MCAVRSALEEGIIPGGGLALWKIAVDLDADRSDDEDYNAAVDIICEAIRSPLHQILINAGKDIESVTLHLGVGPYGTKNYGYDVKNEEYGDMFKMGIIDPLKVTKNALINAVSVATTILSTN